LWSLGFEMRFCCQTPGFLGPNNRQSLGDARLQSTVILRRNSAGATISISLNRLSGRRCFLSPVTINCASAATPHSRIISSPGSGVAPSVRSFGKTNVAASDRAAAQSTYLWPWYSRRSSSMVSWYSAKSSGLTTASHRPLAHLDRQSNGAPRQNVALATTLVSKTTFKLYFDSERARLPETPSLHLGRSFRAVLGRRAAAT